jgi:hypothetical protein
MAVFTLLTIRNWPFLSQNTAYSREKEQEEIIVEAIVFRTDSCVGNPTSMAEYGTYCNSTRFPKPCVTI